MENSKDTNPKEAVGETKVPLALLSPIAQAYWAAAQFCGLTKYGAWNWREAGVRASTYVSALGRHLAAYSSGEEYDPVDGTHHLGNAMACCAILLEARAIGKLTDDRGPDISRAMRVAFAEVEENMKQIKTRYVDKNPRHYTIADSKPKVFNVEQVELTDAQREGLTTTLEFMPGPCKNDSCPNFTARSSGYCFYCG